MKKIKQIFSLVLSALVLTFLLSSAAKFAGASTVPITPAVFETALASPQQTTDTTLTLANGNLVNGNPLTGFTCFTIDSGQANLEYECGTAAGASVTGLVRGIDPLTGTSTDSQLVYAHRRGADVKITDFPFSTIVGRIVNGIDAFPNGITVMGTTTLAGNFFHFGSTQCNGPLSNSGIGLELCGSSNSDNGGVNFQVGNNSNGNAAFGSYLLNNDISDQNIIHYSALTLNSSTYSSPTFGSALAIPNQLELQNTDGLVSLISSTSTNALNPAGINFVTGGSDTTNERMRITTSGKIGIGTTNPTTGFTVATTTNFTQETTAITPVNPTDIANKTYVDNVAVSGAPNANDTTKGLVQTATTLQAASGTSVGSTGARLALGANIATSTYNPSGSLQVVVTGNNNKIDPGFINLNGYAGTISIATSSLTVGSFPAYNIGKNFKSFTSVGTSTFSVPSGITKVYVRVQGAGGGGGQGVTTSIGSPGGAGGYSEGFIDVTGTSTIQVFVGSGGAGHTGSQGVGNQGTWSTFGTNGFYMSAFGALGGNADSTGGGIGGNALGGDINIQGQTGQATELPTAAGLGGSSHMGFGGSFANNGTGFGSGGGPGDASNANAGNGANGGVFITW